MARYRWIAVTAGVIAAVPACDGSPAAPPGTPGLSIVDGGDGSDTVTAVMRPLEVEVRGSNGRIRKAVAVSFEAVPDTAGEASAQFRSTASGPWYNVLSGATDAHGRALVSVRLGKRSGPSAVVIRVPSLGLEDTARYSIRPGHAIKMVVAPADTGLFVGGTYEVRLDARDRLGNSVFEPLVLESSAPEISTASPRVRGESPGRASISVRMTSGHRTFSQNVRVTVVPRGFLAAYEFPAYHDNYTRVIDRPGRVVTVGLDGSEFRPVAVQQPPVVPISAAEGMHPGWSPLGPEVVFVDDGKLLITTADGVPRTLVSGGDPVNMEFSPLFDPSGGWIYYTRGRRWEQGAFWRIRPNGTENHRISPAAGGAMPSPDPTGTRMVYQAKRAPNSTISLTLWILDVTTGGVLSLGVPGMYPRWSPTGEWIAYVDSNSRLRRVRPDGSDDRPIGTNELRVHPVFSWSPDGEWLIASGVQVPEKSSEFGLVLIRVSNGEQLPLMLDRRFVQPSWRP